MMSMIQSLLTGIKRVCIGVITLGCIASVYAGDIPLPPGAQDVSGGPVEARSCETCPEKVPYRVHVYAIKAPLEEIQHFYEKELRVYNLFDMNNSSQEPAKMWAWYDEEGKTHAITLSRSEDGATQIIHSWEVSPSQEAFPQESLVKPDPITSAELTRKDFFVNGEPVTMHHYQTKADFNQVKDFYVYQLSQKGWRLVPQEGVSETALLRRGDEATAIVKIPSQGKETEYIVTQGTMQESTTAEEEPDILPKPGFLQQTMYIKDPESKTLAIGYEGNTSVADVLSFYREAMARKGWILRQERNLREVAGALPQGDERSQWLREFLQGADNAVLMFQGNYGQCMVSVIGIDEETTMVEVRYAAQQ